MYNLRASGGLMSKKLPVKAVDLFCGAGGLTHGLTRAGIEVVAGYDIDESCRYPFEKNNNSKFINRDVTTLAAEELREHLKGATHTMLAGCAPCQPFSTYSRTVKSPKKQDSRWNLLTSFGSLIAAIQPDFVTMENVPGLADQKVFQDFLEQLDTAGYEYDYKVVYCPDYGMAQTRKRLVLVGSKLGKIKLPAPTHTEDTYLSVKEAIGHLPKISAGETHSSDPLHKSAKLSPLNLERIKASKQGGSWLDWPQELRAECHKKESGKTYPSVYGRMSWDKPAPTITTQCYGFGNGRFGHPDQNRAISLREAAILQSFPQKYAFTKTGEQVKTNNLARMIGNAVPVRLGEIVGESIKETLAH